MLVLCLLMPVMAISSPRHPDLETFYLGTVSMTGPKGGDLGSSASLVKRVVSRESRKIVEYILLVGKKSPAREIVTFFDITGNHFHVYDRDRTFSGRGELQGDPWDWYSWSYSVKMSDGSGVLKGKDLLAGKHLIVEKFFYGNKGQLRVQFFENLKPISKELYELLLKNLTKK